MIRTALLHLVRLSALAALMVGAARVSAGPAGADGPTQNAASVSIDEFFFSPDPVIISVGQAVEWTNDGTLVHTTTHMVVNDKVWDSGDLQPGESFQFTFSQPGAYDYICSRHPGSMQGQLIVEVPTATPTITATPTAGPSPTSTATATATSTPTATATSTPSATPSSSPSPTATATPTTPGVPSATPMPTGTSTDTPTATSTTTSTATSTATASPSPTASSTITPSPTVAPTETPRPTPVPSAAELCAWVLTRVPEPVINDALANPHAVLGFMQLRDPGKPPSPVNPRRIYLSLRATSLPWHPLANPLVFKAACP